MPILFQSDEVKFALLAMVITTLKIAIDITFRRFLA